MTVAVALASILRACSSKLTSVTLGSAVLSKKSSARADFFGAGFS
jgi:hypothetical protein